MPLPITIKKPLLIIVPGVVYDKTRLRIILSTRTGAGATTGAILSGKLSYSVHDA